MDLPRELTPWRQSLSIFPQELAIALGGIVDRLALLIGPLVSPDSSGRDQPDGVGGIGRRGSFERLLATDWALADEAPLEFLRRVSTGELSFLEIAHQKPTVARHSVVLFDVGPDQRGAPRIVQLALLILLAQRAQAGGASFAWGILQDNSGEFITDVNEESVRRLVQGGSLRRVAIEDVMKYYQALPGKGAEVWFVGGAVAYEITANVTPFRIAIEDSLDPNAPSNVDVMVVGPKGKPKSISLELPMGNVAVRLIRDPFRVARAVPQKTPVTPAHDTNLIISRDDRLLFLLGSQGELISIPILNSPNCKNLPNPRIFRPQDNEVIFAVGRLMEARAVGVLTTRGEQFHLHRLSHRMGSSVASRPYVLDVNSGDKFMQSTSGKHYQRAPLGQLFQLGREDSLFLHDSGIAMLKLEPGVLRFHEFPAIAPIQLYNGLSWMRLGNPSTWETHDGTKQTSIELPPNIVHASSTTAGNLLIQHSAQSVEIIDLNGTVMHERKLPADVQLIGAAHVQKYQYYVLDASRTQISCLEDDNAECCIKMSAPVKTITATVGCWLIAFLTEENELCIYSREYKTLIFRMRLGQS